MSSKTKPKKTKSRGNGEGTIYNNGRYWVGQVTIGYDPVTGKVKRKSIYGKTRGEVVEKMTTSLHQVNTNTRRKMENDHSCGRAKV